MLEQVIVPPLPEVQLVGRVARVRAPLVAVAALAVPQTGLRDPTDASLEFEEEKEEDEEVEEEEELEMFNESIDQFEHSSFRPRRLCRHYMAGRCDEGWSCTFAHGRLQLVEQIVGAPVPQITVELTKEIAEKLVGVTMPQILGISWQVCGSYHMGACLRARSFEEIVEVTQSIPHERIVVVPVPPFRNKLWESRSFLRRSGFSASQRRSWNASTTDHGESGEVIQLLRVARERRLWLSRCHRSVGNRFCREEGLTTRSSTVSVLVMS